MRRLDNAKNEYLNFKEMDKKLQSITDNTVYCQNCGHSITMPNADRAICSWCKKWVYRTKEIEFKYKTKEAIIKEKR
jgi:uncharacterized paraquat-inducible protein A